MAYRSNYESQVPNGNAFLVSTPQTDQARDQVYQQQMQRQMFAQREAMQADQEMGKEFANVRDADMPELMDKYQKFKNLQTQMYMDPSIANNPKKYMAANQAAMQALGETHALINDSKQKKQMLLDLNKVRSSAHHDLLSDDYGDKIALAQNTPSSQLTNTKYGDLSNTNGYMYQGQNTDWGKITKTASGLVGTQPTATDITPSKTDPLKDEVVAYHAGATPAQFKTSYYGQLGSHTAGRDAAATWDTLSTTPDGQEYINETNRQFAAIPPERWRQMTGSSTPQNLEPANPDDKGEQLASLRAKHYAIADAQIDARTSEVTNATRTMQANEQKWAAQNQVTFRERKIIAGINSNNTATREVSMLDAKQHMAELNDEEQNKFAKNYLDTQADGAQGQQPVTVKATDGTTVEGKPLPATPVNAIASEFVFTNGSHKVPATQFLIDGDDMVGTATFNDASTGEPVTKVIRKSLSSLIPVARKDLSGGIKAPVTAPPSHNHQTHTPVAKGSFDDLK